MSKSGSPKKRKKLYSERIANEQAERERKNAAAASSNASLLLRSIAHLIQFPDLIDREKGVAKIPLDVIGTDIEVDVHVNKKSGHLLFSVPPVVPVEEEKPLTHDVVRDILALASKHATLDDIAKWLPEQQEEAVKWASEVYSGAAVEEPPFPKVPPEPEHVARLARIDGIDFDGKGHATTRLTWPDGRQETITSDIPKE